MWQINSNFGAFKMEKVGLDNKVPKAAPTIFVDLQNLSERSDACPWSSKKIASRKVFIKHSFYY